MAVNEKDAAAARELTREELSAQVARLRRENHILRLQLLKIQDERRAARHANDTGAGGALAGDGGEDTDALRLRLTTLLRQSEREKQRRLRTERELREEVERLRLALDQRSTSVSAPAGASVTESTALENGNPLELNDAAPSTPCSAQATKSAEPDNPLFFETCLSEVSPPSPGDSAGAAAVAATSVAHSASTHTTDDEAEASRRYQESVDRYANGGAVRFDPLSADGDGARSGAQDADDFVRRAADRRALRQQRLQRLSSTVPADADVSASTTAAPPRDGATDEAHSRAPVSGASSRSGSFGSSEDLEERAAVVAAHAKEYAEHLFNPNQIGVEIKEEEKNRTWYLKQVIAETLLYAVRPQSDAASTTASPPPPLAPAGGAAQSSAGGSGGRGVYKEVSAAAMQRAVDECLPVHFHCAVNRPVATPNYTDGAPVSTLQQTGKRDGDVVSVTVPRLGAFRDQNTDPNLLAAFTTHATSAWDDDMGDRDTVESDNASALSAASSAASGWVGPGGFSTSPGAGADLRAIHTTHRHGHRIGRSASISSSAAGGASSAAERELSSRYRDDELLVQYHSPVLFSQIRSFLRLDDNFLRSAVANSVWRQSASPGKSRTTLYYFSDFVMKSMKDTELVFFNRHFLPQYVQYCERNPHTLLPRFYAVVTVRWLRLNVRKVFILMQNVFATRYFINRIYDVKGSTVGRSAFKKHSRNSQSPPSDAVSELKASAPRTAFGALLLKDNDLPPQLVICGPYQRAILLAQFRGDVTFLASLNIVDFSCMIGVRSRVFAAEKGPSKTIVLRRRRPAAHYHQEPESRRHGRRRRQSADGNNGSGNGAGGARGRDEEEVASSVIGIGSLASFPSTSALHGEDPAAVAAAAVSAGNAYGYAFGDGAAGGGSGGAASATASPPAPAPTVPVSTSDAEDDLFVCLHGCDGGLLSLPIYAPGDDTTAREDVYYLGIIDVLQEYNSVKKLENFAKGLLNDRKKISVIPPKDYAERLYQVLERIAV